MPVTIRPSNASAAATTILPAATSIALFKLACTTHRHRAKDNVIMESIRFDRPIEENIIGSDNAFVHGVVRAYDQQHHLTIRPDDVWISILTQFSAYLNRQWDSKEKRRVRDTFEIPCGKIRIKLEEMKGSVEDSSIFWGVSFDTKKLCTTISSRLRDNIKDPMKTFAMPQFSTTKAGDQLAAAVILNSASQRHKLRARSSPLPKECLTSKNSIGPGLSSVTLLGNKADWEALLSKTRAMLGSQAGQEPAEWDLLLRPILSRMVKSFDKPEASYIKRFWQDVAYFSGGEPEPIYLSGWITAFCFWAYNGDRLCKSGMGRNGNPSLRPDQFFFSPFKPGPNVTRTPILELGDGRCVRRYHRIKIDDIPAGFSTAPFLVEISTTTTSHEFEFCAVTAGSASLKFSNKVAVSNTKQEDGGGLNAIKPKCAWWMYETNTLEEALKS